MSVARHGRLAVANAVMLAVHRRRLRRIAAVHGKQLLTYLRLFDLPRGLLINFVVEPACPDFFRSFAASHEAPSSQFLGPFVPSPISPLFPAFSSEFCHRFVIVVAVGADGRRGAVAP